MRRRNAAKPVAVRAMTAATGTTNHACAERVVAQAKG